MIVGDPHIEMSVICNLPVKSFGHHALDLMFLQQRIMAICSTLTLTTTLLIPRGICQNRGVYHE
jgi:hypothetical protein